MEVMSRLIPLFFFVEVTCLNNTCSTYLTKISFFKHFFIKCGFGTYGYWLR